MAEFLIRAIDNVSSHSQKRDQAGSYKRGDIVQAYEDGTCIEQPSEGSNAYIIKVPKYPLSASIRFMDKEVKDGVDTTRRRYSMDLDSLSVEDKNTLETTRWITLSLSYMRNMFNDKELGGKAVWH